LIFERNISTENGGLADSDEENLSKMQIHPATLDENNEAE